MNSVAVIAYFVFKVSSGLTFDNPNDFVQESYQNSFVQFKSYSSHTSHNSKSSVNLDKTNEN